MLGSVVAVGFSEDDDVVVPAFERRFGQRGLAVRVERLRLIERPDAGAGADARRDIAAMVIGPSYLIDQTTAGTLTGNAALTAGQDFFFYILNNCFQFAVYLTILQLGVRTFVAELTVSFQGISSKLLKGSVPGVDCAVTYGFGSTNAVTLGFLAGAVGQFLAIGALLVFHSPVLVVAGFVPLFFDNATLGVFANNKGGLKACLICPFICGLLQVFGSALIASWVGMAAYGGYLGMFDWATIWPAFTVIMPSSLSASPRWRPGPR